jgi:hypothetical protein
VEDLLAGPHGYRMGMQRRSVERTYPSALSQAVKAELVCDLGGVHGILEGC